MVYANAWELLLFCPAGIRITKSHDGRSWIGEYRVAHKQTDYALQEEFLDVIFWLRQLFAVIIGIIWGVLPLKGIIGIVLFCMVNTALVYIYASYFQQVDEEDFGDSWEFAKEGFMTTFAGFLVSWIIVYTGLHADDPSLA